MLEPLGLFTDVYRQNLPSVLPDPGLEAFVNANTVGDLHLLAEQ